jgi:hypothetical protein
LSRRVYDIDINKVYNKVDQLIKIAKIATDETIEDELVKLADIILPSGIILPTGVEPPPGVNIPPPGGVEKQIILPPGVERPEPARTKTPPAEKPKVETPPAEKPKVETPPAESPKTKTPPAEKPPEGVSRSVWERIKGFFKGLFGPESRAGRGLGYLKGKWHSLGRAGRIGVGATAATAALATLGYLLYRMFSGGGDTAAAAVGPEAGAGPSPFGSLLGSITLPDIVGAGGLGLVLYDLLRKRKKAPGEASNVLADYWPTILGLAAAGLGFAPRIVSAFK